MIETEAKIKISDADVQTIRDRLELLGASRKPQLLQETNYILSKPSHDSHPEDPAFRVRLYSSSGDGLFTVKNIPPLSVRGREKSGLKKVPELLNVDLTRADLLLHALLENGFQAAFAYSKTREDWNHGNLLINIDKLPELGFFIEIEGEEKEVLDMVGLLGLGERPRHVLSYPEIYQDFKERGEKALWEPIHRVKQ